MVIDEIFPKPTVDKVIFQVRYSNLFFLENKIGELQMKIIDSFPESSLLIRRQVLIAELGTDIKIETPQESNLGDITKKIWQFKSEKGYVLNVLSDSLAITSELHKTYNNPKADHRFRDIIKIVVDSFLEITGLPLFKRIGLRYIDHCPIRTLDNGSFQQWYNSSFPLNRFGLSESEELHFQAVSIIGDYRLRYIERFDFNQKNKLILDFDGFAQESSTKDYLNVLDELHRIISNAYEATIKEPVKEYMRHQEEDYDEKH